MIGGAFLCFEGCEKLAHRFLHSAEEDAATMRATPRPTPTRPWTWPALEQGKIKAAVRTDFILGRDHRHHPGHGGGRTAGAAGGRAGGHCRRDDGGRLWPGGSIVKLDDLGLWLSGQLPAAPRRRWGAAFCWPPPGSKSLSVIGHGRHVPGGRGILVHGYRRCTMPSTAWARWLAAPALGGLWALLTTNLLNAGWAWQLVRWFCWRGCCWGACAVLPPHIDGHWQ